MKYEDTLKKINWSDEDISSSQIEGTRMYILLHCLKMKYEDTLKKINWSDDVLHHKLKSYVGTFMNMTRSC
ncbi:Hypothetical predicted protein [Mytilus galloprovincialis]|uniref:Uncharacterized protein n=1 Tax=Mytilus galloprovincialis TaxID=29158 RepID=A0A8B6GVQ7_MYTGA|nr:Hypothetical predicted protein [Mytilus galloprovincialis]